MILFSRSIGNTTMCGLFKVKGGAQTGACCTTSPFEVMVGGSWTRTGLPSILPGAPSSKVAVPLPAAAAGQPVQSLRYAWADPPRPLKIRSWYRGRPAHS